MKYRVLNPHGHPAEINGERVPICGHDVKTPSGLIKETLRYYEGDVFEAPKGFDADGRLLREGFVEVVQDG